MDEPNFNLNRKKFRIHWHGYDHWGDISEEPKKDNNLYCSMTWMDAVNQFLEDRFNHGPRFFFIDYYEEWDEDKEDGYDA